MNTLLEPLPGLEAYRPRIRYLVLDEQHYDEQELAEISGLAQALFRLERSRTPDAMNEVVGILADALKGSFLSYDLIIRPHRPTAPAVAITCGARPPHAAACGRDSGASDRRRTRGRSALN